MGHCFSFWVPAFAGMTIEFAEMALEFAEMAWEIV